VDADSFSCYVWKKSQFYSKIPKHPKAWQLRWCTVDGHGFRTARMRGLKQGTRAMDIFNTFAVRARKRLGPCFGVIVGTHCCVSVCRFTAPMSNTAWLYTRWRS
jgi:hypothetical protein